MKKKCYFWKMLENSLFSDEVFAEYSTRKHIYPSRKIFVTRFAEYGKILAKAGKKRYDC
jgi:hypothetical protein